MAFPNDLSNVTVFKIHPAIGVARLANNDDYYEFFEHKTRQGGESGLQCDDKHYMSPQPNPYSDSYPFKQFHTMKRQAVQFRLFAYGSDNRELGELSKEIMSNLQISPTWRATICNRKLNYQSEKKRNIIKAEGDAAKGRTVRLEGTNPFRPDSKIWLGDLTSTGIFIPPKGGVYREDELKEISDDFGFQDTTSDGEIRVFLEGAGAESKPVIPAAVVVAPQDHSPDISPAQAVDGDNADFIIETEQKLGNELKDFPDGAGYLLDKMMMNTLNADYNPGMEICLDYKFGPLPEDLKKAFYTPGASSPSIVKGEIRPKYKEKPGDEDGVEHGALTAGLCSVWQTDLTACLNYWTAEYPNKVQFKVQPKNRYLSRKKFLDDDEPSKKMCNPEWLNAYIDNMDVARDLKKKEEEKEEEEEEKEKKLWGTERDADDNMGDIPKGPFPLDPPR